MRFKRVAVVMGGTSSEREISLRSGRAIAAGLATSGYSVFPVVLESNSVNGVLPDEIEAVFIALHGGYGENGGIQADLDARGLPYTGSGAAASRLAMDKIATKRACEAAGVVTPPYEVLEAGSAHTTMRLPLVVKPPCDGSSVGVGLVREAGEWEAALAQARRMDPDERVLVETFIAGREWTVGVLLDDALPAVEILAPDGWFGFNAKYTPGASRIVFPDDPADRALADRCGQIACRAFHAVGCRGLGRVDFRITSAGEPYVLEINTVPGFTETSLLPKAAARQGIAFPELCARILEAARCG
jgi:D-alanine-D-alanine ligase